MQYYLIWNKTHRFLRITIQSVQYLSQADIVIESFENIDIELIIRYFDN